MNEDDDGEEPNLFDYWVAGEFPFLSSSGFFGKGPQKAWEELLPLFGCLGIITLVIIVVAILLTY